jgi:mono/diheme cytochrome c family protein
LLLALGLSIPFDTATAARSPEQIYQGVCARCHEEGIAPSIKGFPAALIQWKVRNSVGAMPRFPLTDIDDKTLGELGTYVQNLKPTPASASEGEHK